MMMMMIIIIIISSSSITITTIIIIIIIIIIILRRVGRGAQVLMCFMILMNTVIIGAHSQYLLETPRLLSLRLGLGCIQNVLISQKCQGTCLFILRHS